MGFLKKVFHWNLLLYFQIKEQHLSCMKKSDTAEDQGKNDMIPINKNNSEL